MRKGRMGAPLTFALYEDWVFLRLSSISSFRKGVERMTLDVYRQGTLQAQ